jgi:ASC-1-like (ASCH) protein
MMNSPRVLHLNLHREHFATIVAGTKRIEYRDQSAHWRSRLEGKAYDVVQFRNGYSAKAPEMTVKFLGVRRYGRGKGAYYAIRLGPVLAVKRWKPAG